MACGAGEFELESIGLWYPSLLLIASLEGAHGVGIDINGYPESEGFYHHIQADLLPYLTNVQSLIELFADAPSEYSPPFDAIVCLNFLDNISPTLNQRLSTLYPGKDELKWKVIRQMKENVLTQSLELGKEGTIVKSGINTYQIRDGKLVEKSPWDK